MAVIGSLFFVAVDLWGTFGSYYHLKRNRRSLSDRTISLYRTLINVLVADLCFSTVNGFGPMLVTFAPLKFQWPNGASIGVAPLTMSMLYPCCANIILLAYVMPYRRAVMELFRFKAVSKLFTIRNNASVTVTSL